ncbi:MAG TPA: Tex family protein [Candidatus Acidoferrum sp.]|nr:Tex family protein [Candidatus Acidoferrum sp.]
MDYSRALSAEFSLKPEHSDNIIKLIGEGNTLPFIARYRKELTGAIDDQLLRKVADRLSYLQGLDKRRLEVLSAIDAQGKLTGELRDKIEAATTLTALEDLYLPFKKRRTTRGGVARERGLEPLAAALFAAKSGETAEELAAPYVDPEKELPDAAAAIAGALDIIAEDLSVDAALREKLRRRIGAGVLCSAAKKEADSVYRLYYDFKEPAATLPAHRILAINRGEAEDYLKVAVEADDAACLGDIYAHIGLAGLTLRDVIKPACGDAYDRLIFPSLSRELRGVLTDRAAEAAIRSFAMNLKHLLMQPPVRGAVTLGVDPAYRTGCKLAVVDAVSRVLATGVIYPTPPANKTEEAARTVSRLIKTHGVTTVAIGNGTASRETEAFIASVLAVFPGVKYMIVNEAGASVYSASALAAEEFPEYDVSLRSAVSIARRMQDPLAELVKIPPEAIGVGQYQHDMPGPKLSHSLDGVVEDCVNTVGVDLNTASSPLLTRVAGIGPVLAKNIVAHREEAGPFAERKQLLKVKGLGKKAYEQCAGFLRIPGGRQLLDNTAVHPESYEAALELLKRCGLTPDDVVAGRAAEKLKEDEATAKALGVGLPTLADITAELRRPGRDPRDELPPPLLRHDVLSLKDLKPGMELAGTVRNVIDFGAFVDIGVHEDGLVHISQLANRFVRHPSEVVKVGDVVTVRVLEVDEKRGRISLTMKKQK